MKGKRVCNKHGQAFEAGEKCEYCEELPDIRADADVEQTVQWNTLQPWSVYWE